MPFKSYLINKILDRKFRVNGILPSTRLPHKHQLRQSFDQHRIYSDDQLPPKVDLRPEMPPVEDQSQIGSCTANCLAGAYEYLIKKADGNDIDVSRLFIYYNARVKANNSNVVTDSGCSMTDSIEALEEFGTCLESYWPYDIANVNTRPDDQAYQEAQGHKITQAMQVNIDLNEMKSCLAQGFPFAFGLKLYKSFDKAATTGIVPMPNSGDGSRESDGSHALLAVGYSDQSQAFIVRNSWGADWGDKGYCYIPYNYITDSDLCFDVWSVRNVETDDFGQEHWHSNDATNYLHGHHHHSSNDNDNDDNHSIQGFDENDDDNGNGGYGNDQNAWGNDYNPRPDDYSDPYQGNDNNSYNDNQYDQGYNQYDDGYNADRNFPYSDNDQFRDGRNNFGGYSDYN